MPAEVLAKVDQYLAAIDSRSAPSQFSGMLRTGLRYQSNANAGPGNSTVTLNGLSYTLDGLSVAGEDFNAFTNGAMRYRHDTDIQGLALEAGLSGYAAGYRDRDTLNTAAAEAYAGPIFDLGRFGLDDRTVSILAMTSGVLIEGDRYLASVGLSTNFDWQVTPIDSLALSLQYRYEDYSNTKSRKTAACRVETGSMRRPPGRTMSARISAFRVGSLPRGETPKPAISRQPKSARRSPAPIAMRH